MFNFFLIYAKIFFYLFLKIKKNYVLVHKSVKIIPLMNVKNTANLKLN